jgi:glyceraldehyde 3-phosphate dehydrogenase
MSPALFSLWENARIGHMKNIKVAINGFGRIGRAFLREAVAKTGIDVVGVNDLGSLENLAYLLKYDTVYGRAPFEVGTKDGALVVDGTAIRFTSEKDPANLPWKELAVDIVVESSGVFTDYEKARTHITAGAKRVVITAPVKEGEGVSGATVLIGLNQEKLAKFPISTNASCTTNAASPIIAILDGTVGVEAALLNTTHTLTGSQSIVDSISKKDWREGRAGGHNIIPSSTGAAIAVTKAYPALEGKFDGIAMRVPVIIGSVADITFIAKHDTSKDEINEILRKAAQEERWKGIFRASDEELVSSDVIGDPHTSIADLKMTRVVGKRLVKVLAWYDNEFGYTVSLLRHVLEAGKYL